MGLDPRELRRPLLITYDGFNHLIRLANGNAWTALVTQFLACSVSSIHRNNLQVNYLAHRLIA